MSGPWEVHAIKYADRDGRTRADSFIGDPNPSGPHAMDYFIWLLRRGAETILVDTGYDAAEGEARGRPIRLDPRKALEPFGLAPEDIATIVVTHLHYDHAGGLHLFPKAHLHLQAAEMAFATGSCMCEDHLRAPFTGAHVGEAVKALHAGRLTFHDGDAQVAEGVSVHRIGGHSRGLQCVRVATEAGWLVLASDAAHYWENVESGRPFPIVVDVEDMLRGFRRIVELASPGLMIPGHDPLVRKRFPRGIAEHVTRLDRGPR